MQRHAHVSGGSSGGSAAAVAAGMAHIGIGSDTGAASAVRCVLVTRRQAGLCGCRLRTAAWSDSSPATAVSRASASLPTPGAHAHVRDDDVIAGSSLDTPGILASTVHDAVTIASARLGIVMVPAHVLQIWRAAWMRTMRRRT